MKWLILLPIVLLEAAYIGDVEALKSMFFASSESIFIFILFAALCFISWIQMMLPLDPVIEFETRSTRKSFLERNKEQIYVGLIVGVPVAIVSFVLGIITVKL